MEIAIDLDHLKLAKVNELNNWVDCLNKCGPSLGIDKDKLELRYCDIKKKVYLVGVSFESIMRRSEEKAKSITDLLRE